MNRASITGDAPAAVSFRVGRHVNAREAIFGPPVARLPTAVWSRDFPGFPVQVREVRRFIEALLPGCGPREDCLLLATELCTNAVLHTRSGQADGQFSVHVEWTPERARVVVGDQGPSVAAAGEPEAGKSGLAAESGRGLWLVDEIAADWGTASYPGGRCTWFDVRWAARGGPPLIAAMARPGRGRARLGAAGSAALAGGEWLPVAGRSPGRLDPPGGVPLSSGLIAREPETKGTDVSAVVCLCGFAEQADESLVDHLERVFAPPDMRGTDGLVHEEMGDLACACGFTAIKPAQLDTHFLAVFMTADGAGADGQKHGIPAEGQ